MSRFEPDEKARTVAGGRRPVPAWVSARMTTRGDVRGVQRRARGEEGQVYPALLLAVVGGLALMVGFLGLQNLLDQDGRAESASDAAALAVGADFRENAQGLLGGPGLGGLSGLGSALDLLRSGGDLISLNEVAERFASANGADVSGPVRFEGFDPGESRWVFAVTTRQKDTVKGGDRSARQKSESRVAITVNGLCGGGTGITLGGTCMSPTELLKACVAPTDEPTPTPPPSPDPSDSTDSPTPSPQPTKTFTPPGLCGVDLTDLLQWQIKLIN